MYKEIIICLVIIISVVTVNNVSQNYTDKLIEEKRNYLYRIKDKTTELMVEDDEPNIEIVNMSNSILDEWKKQYLILAIYLEHDELEKVEKELVSLKANAEVGEYDEMMENIEMSIFSLEHLKDKEVFNLDNFF